MSTSPREHQVQAQIVRLIDALRDRARALHGMTHVELSVQVDPQARRVRLVGEVLVHNLARHVARAAREALPPGWMLDASGIALLGGRGWLLPKPEPIQLVSRPPGQGGGGLVTEWLPGDGPLELLVQLDPALVRGSDGTVGWTPLTGRATVAPCLAAPSAHDGSAIVQRARAYLGVPYVLGGATAVGIDCSALVQRAAAEALGVVVPRHSSDQLAISPSPGRGRCEAGDLVFVWTRHDGPCHVGVATGAGTVIHASRSRRAVVEDPCAGFLAGSSTPMHVSFCAVLAFGRKVAGYASLVAAGYTLGCPPGVSGWPDVDRTDG